MQTHRRPFVLALSFLATLQACGSGITEGAAPVRVLDAASTTADGAGGDGASSDTAQSAVDGDRDARLIDGADGGRGTPHADAASDDTEPRDSESSDAAASADTAPPDTATQDVASATWGCAENSKVCVCYDVSFPGYSNPTCATAYPCCARFVVHKTGTAPYGSCDCYTDAYLSEVGRSCTQEIERINGISTYSGATQVTSCPP